MEELQSLPLEYTLFFIFYMYPLCSWAPQLLSHVSWPEMHILFPSRTALNFLNLDILVHVFLLLLLLLLAMVDVDTDRGN